MKINEIKEKVNMFVESKNFRKILYILGSVFILFFVIQFGMMAGYNRASYSRNWGNNYERNFGPMRSSQNFIKNDLGYLPNAHGAIGRIIKVELPNIVVLDKDKTEKIIIVKDDTNILERRDAVNKEGLKVDQFIIVIGNPNGQGQIEAKLIRIMPNPDDMKKINMRTINNETI